MKNKKEYYKKLRRIKNNKKYYNHCKNTIYHRHNLDYWWSVKWQILHHLGVIKNLNVNEYYILYYIIEEELKTKRNKRLHINIKKQMNNRVNFRINYRDKYYSMPLKNSNQWENKYNYKFRNNYISQEDMNYLYDNVSQEAYKYLDNFYRRINKTRE